MRKLHDHGADKRPIPKELPTLKQILEMSPEEAMTALLDYDGPIRSLLERLISTEPDQAHVLMPYWGKEAKQIMNVVYKVNGLTQRWAEE